MRSSRIAFAIVALATVSCAAIIGIKDTTDEGAPTNLPPVDASSADGDPIVEDDGSTGIDEEPALEDAGTYADVADIDAQVTTCAETGLVARWKIDEGTGTVVSDCSGNKLHGIITKGTWTNDGADGGALLFAGNGWVGFANPPLLRITGAVTVALWMRADRDTAATEYVVGKSSNPGTNGWRLAVIDATRQLAFATPSTAGAFNVVGGSMPLGKWRHVAAVFDPGKKSEVYISGARVGVHSSGAPSALVATSAEARIAARFDGAYGFTGAISDVRVYNRALTATEIAAISTR